jgi:hypothetical protein
VDEADAARAGIAELRVGPVVGARQRRQGIRGDADADEPARGGLGLAATDEVEESWRSPTSRSRRP